MLVDTKELTNVKDIINGFHVEAKRTRIGHWCGYITVPSTHPWAQSEESYAEDCDINVHGGVTFYKKDNDGNAVVGFDCGHSWDASPSWSEHKSFTSSGGQYRDIHYVLNELKDLASQARVCVECDSLEDANDQAELNGISFGMFGSSECCGPRWSREKAWDEDSLTETPTHYGDPISEAKDSWAIHYKDGTKLSGEGKNRR